MGTKLKFFTIFHPQIDSQIEVVNRSLRILLRCLVGEHLRNWDLTLPNAEFAYKSSCNRSKSMSLFEVVHSHKLRKRIDLIRITQNPRVSESASAFALHIHDLLKKISKKIKKVTLSINPMLICTTVGTLNLMNVIT